MAQINIRIEDDLRDKAEVFLNELGLTFSSAFNVFIRQAIRERRIPFEISIRDTHIHEEYELTEAELVLRADEMNRGINIVQRELIEVEND